MFHIDSEYHVLQVDKPMKSAVLFRDWYSEDSAPCIARCCLQAVQYGDIFQYVEDEQVKINESPLWLVRYTQTFTLNAVTTTRSLYLRREGPWNDVTLVAKAEQNGEEIAMDASFKNEFSRLEGNVKVNTPFDGFK